ncbi:hypothetical protein [Arenibaculum pallidiluteum]|uniref:hypothetical protein n=1 Tax=Arenibaculum pallidiluteum TaxID=2812559 RepID=UPI001A95DAC0|nr:hypothetical protein [Arenibaculum pallidiluteum]
MTVSDRTVLRLCLVGLAVVVVPWLATLAASMLSAAHLARDAAGARMEIVGGSMARDLNAYLGIDISLDRGVGFDAYLAEDLAGEDEVMVALIATEDGRVVGHYLRPGRDDLVGRRFTAQSDWRALHLAAATFPIVHKGQQVGRLILARDAAPGIPHAGRVVSDFLVALGVILAIGAQHVLVAYRQSVSLPLQTVAAIERRAERRQFDRTAPVPHGGPAAPVAEALNRLLAALNDRYARVASYLDEIREMSFNPAAPAEAARYQAALAASARFAPEGLKELRVHMGDLFAGPSAFCGGVVAGIAGALASLSATTEAGEHGILPAATAVATGLLAAALAARLGPRVRILGGGAVAFAGGLALSFLSGTGATLAGAALAVAGSASVAAAVAPLGIRAAAGRIGHAAAGIATGGGVVVLDSGHFGMWASYPVAAVALGAGLLLALRSAPPAVARERRRLSTKRLGQVMLAAVLASPAWLLFVAFGVWLALARPDAAAVHDGSNPTRDLGLFVFAAGFALAMGAAAGRLAIQAWPGRTGAELAHALTSFLLVLVPGVGLSIFEGGGAVATAALLGAGLAGATECLAARKESGMLTATSGLVAGVALALAVAPSGSPTLGASVFATVTLAGAGLAVLSLWDTMRGPRRAEVS